MESDLLQVKCDMCVNVESKYAVRVFRPAKKTTCTETSTNVLEEKKISRYSKTVDL